MRFFRLRFGHSVLHQVLLADESLQIRMQFRFASRLMAHGGFQAGDAASQITATSLHFTKLIVNFRQGRISRTDFRFRGDLTRSQVLNDACGFLHLCDQNIANIGFTAEIVGRETDPKLFQFRRDSSITCRTLSLRSDSADLSFHFVDKIRQSDEIGLDSLQTLQRFGSFLLEATDAGRFFKNQASVGRVRLQNLIDSSLFDNTIGGSSGPGTDKEFTNIFQARRVAINKILGIARLPNSSANGDFVHVDWNKAAAIVEDKRRFGELGTCTAGGSVEDHVRHVFAA